MERRPLGNYFSNSTGPGAARVEPHRPPNVNVEAPKVDTKVDAKVNVTLDGRTIAAAVMFLLCSHQARYHRAMADPERLSPVSPADLAAALAFALRFAGRKRIHNADEIMAEIVAKRLVEHLERSGFVVMRRTHDPFGGATLGRGFRTHE